jgi:preprotein translocase subunit SecG
VLSYILYTLFIISCFVLILVVLLQPGKGDVASALGGGVSGAAFGPRGTTTLLAKITIGAAMSFMGIGFALSVPGLVTDRSVTSGVSTPAIPDDGSSVPPTDGEVPVAPDGTVPAGQLSIDPSGQVTTEAPATAPATPATPADSKPVDSKPADAKPKGGSAPAKSPK